MQKSKSKFNKLSRSLALSPSRFLILLSSYFRALLLSSSLILLFSYSRVLSLSSFFKRERGLSLIEVLAAVSIFTATVSVTMAVFLGLVTSQKRSQNTMNIENNAYFTMEAMAKEIRTGKNFICASGLKSDCLQLQFTNYHNDDVGYRLSSNQIYKDCYQDNNPTGDCPAGAISASALETSYLRFILAGIDEFDGAQAKITIVLEMKTPASVPVAQARDIKLQTTISSRQPDS